MSNKMINYMTKEVMKNRILNEGLKILTGMGLEFTEDQMDTLSRYLDTIIVKQKAKMETGGDVTITDDNACGYINVLLDMIPDLILIGFINFGVAIYHKSKRGK